MESDAADWMERDVGSAERRILWTGTSLSGLHRDGQEIKLEIGGKLLNVLNHPQFDLPAATRGNYRRRNRHPRGYSGWRSNRVRQFLIEKGKSYGEYQ